ncbi:MAG TPA: hypothetical protein VLB72_06365 [Burkholderiales bacterium]|nr:hypothetical protein [Burkholderiales bacterium]
MALDPQARAVLINVLSMLLSLRGAILELTAGDNPEVTRKVLKELEGTKKPIEELIALLGEEGK